MIVYEAIRLEGEDELERTSSALAWYGLASGLPMGFSLVAEGLLKSHLPAADWAPLISKLGYSVGFLIVILGKQQLFTENTILVIIPLLMNPTLACLRNVARLWPIVLVANLLGICSFRHSNRIYFRRRQKRPSSIGYAAVQPGFFTILLKGIVAGWLIALIIWLLPMAETARIAIIVILTYTVGLGKLSYIIAGPAPTLYLAVTGHITIGGYFPGYMIPRLIGNVVGGVSFAAAINNAQVKAGQA